MRYRCGLLVLWFSVCAMAAGAFAASEAGCEGFTWPIDTELEWVTSTDRLGVAAGGEIAGVPTKAIEVTLIPEANAKLAAMPSGAPKQKAEKPYAGIVTVADVQPAGVYQVSLSSAGWIDVVQDGQTLTSVAHTGAANCPALRKSVRFNVASGPAAIQITGAAQYKIMVTIRKVQE